MNQATLLLNEEVQKRSWTRSELDQWNASIGSYAFFWNHYFSKAHDPSLVLGEDNLFCYIPYSKHTLRIQKGDSPLDFFRVIAAALTTQTYFEASISPEIAQSFQLDNPTWLQPRIKITIEPEDTFIQRVHSGTVKKVRILFMPNPLLQEAFAQSECHVIIAPVLANGRIELLHYLREVCYSIAYHRYGYLGLRENEKQSHFQMENS